MAYKRLNDLKMLTDTEYDSMANDFEKRFTRGKADDCWPWTGGTGKHGRGQMVLSGHTVPASRVAYLLYVGDIPDHDSHHGICVLHKCDNPPCVNPKHLFLGTQKDNIRDMHQKGRAASFIGAAHPRTVLTEDQVRAIRKDARRSREIADSYNVSQSVICNLKAYKSWKHLPPHPDDVPVTLRRKNQRRLRG